MLDLHISVMCEIFKNFEKLKNKQNFTKIFKKCIMLIHMYLDNIFYLLFYLDTNFTVHIQIFNENNHYRSMVYDFLSTSNTYK